MPGNVSRDRIVKARGLVLIVNGPGNFFRFSLRFCVEAADDSLQFRKFADHVGDQVALGKFGGAIGCADAGMRNPAGEPLFGEPASQLAHALDFFAVAAELGLIGHGAEFRKIVGEPTFLIRLPEEPGIREPRPQHPLVPRANQAGFGPYRD